MARIWVRAENGDDKGKDCGWADNGKVKCGEHGMTRLRVRAKCSEDKGEVCK